MNLGKGKQQITKKDFNYHDDDWFFELVSIELKKHLMDPVKAKEAINKIPEKMKQCIDEIALLILDSLKKSKDGMVLEYYLIEQAFTARLFQRYQEPISLMQMLYVISFESVEEFNKDCESNFFNKHQNLYQVIILLHARACQIFYEILSLIKNGFADGALARWRSLYEIVVTAYYIESKGDETAKKYLDHLVIDNFKLAKSHKEAIESCSLKEKSISKKDFNKLLLEKERLIEKYGKKFEKDVGWSDKANFNEILDSVQVNHLKPYYIWSNSFIHAGPKGTINRLGLINLLNTQHYRLVGSSNYGFSEPGSLAAISLCQITSIVLSLNRSIYGTCVQMIMNSLVDEIGLSFSKVQKRIIKEEKEEKQNG